VKGRPRIWRERYVDRAGHTWISPHTGPCSRGGPHPLPDHRRELRVAVELAQRDLTGRHEAEEEQERTVLGGERAPCVFTRRRNSSFNRSMLLVVRSVFHWAFGKLKNVRNSVPPSWRLLTTPGHRFPHVRSQAVQAARAASALGA
jgi:hypothetical protein